MTKHGFEFLLGILTGRQRAAEMTGDLLEQHANDVAFWWAACRLLVALTWRPLLGVAAALVAFLFAGLPLGIAWQHAGNPHPHTHWQWLAFGMWPYSMFAWAIACMALVRCGLRNVATATACVLAALLTLESSSFDSPALQVAAIVGFAVVVLAALLVPAHREQSGMLIRAAVAAGVISAASNHAYGAVLRLLPAGFSAAIALSGMLLAFTAGWLAMSTPWRRESPPDQRAAA